MYKRQLLNGMVLSYYFIAFSVSTLVLAFLATSVYFGLMAAYGATTHKAVSYTHLDVYKRQS